MRRILRLTSTRIALGVGALLGVALCSSPLLGAPGIESALVLGIALPPFCAAIGARTVDALRGDGLRVDSLRLLGHAVSASLVVVAIPCGLLVLDLIRLPVCGPLEGVAFLFLGPAISVVLAATLGVLVGAAIPRRRVATTVAVLAPIGLILVGLYRFWDTPAVYAYAHTVGYFPGTLYDPDITVTATYASFRVLSLVWLLAGVALLGLLWEPETHRLRLDRDRWRLGALSALALVAALTGEAWGTELGHRSTSESIAEALGGRVEGERCVAIVPREMPRSDARRLVEDCSLRVAQAERVLGVRQPVPVTAFFFRSADEKRRLMGASNTYVAKPWRNEVYLQVSEWPHPVLFHELVHVVSGNIGRGPFRIAGMVGGLLPSPAIIEGTAVAVAWDAPQGLTPHQWAAAMLEANLAPSIASVEGLGFLLQPASRAYTASGSFVRWLLETEGSAAARRLYLSGSFEEALGRPIAEAEAEWHTFLREEVDLPAEARALAQLRFERPGIFGQICPHAIANLTDELVADLSAGDDGAAIGTCGQILALDPGQAGTRAALVGALARRGQSEVARGELSTLVGPPSAAPPLVQRARQDYADALWRRGRRDEAAAIFRELVTEPMSEDDRRQLEVRLLGIEMGGAGEMAIRELLVPRRDANHDAAVAMSHVAQLARVRDDGLASYLEGRQLLARQRFHLALPRIVEARRRGLPTALLEREARRMEGLARFGRGDREGAARVFRAILRDASSDEGDRVEARDWLTRIRLSGP